MKVRYSVFAAVCAAGAILAMPAAASSSDEKDDAINDAKWRCVIDKKCGEGDSAVGEGIEGPAVRPVIDDDSPVRRIPRTVTSTAPKPSMMAQRSALRDNVRRPMSVGRGMTDAKAVVAPEGVAKGMDLFVTFRRGSADLESGITSDMRSLARVVQESLAAGNKRIIQIGGHTDASGDEAFNLKLSEERAEVIRKSLIELGVPSDAIQSAGYGESKPVDGFAPTHGVNRRVEVVVLN